jgi:hypothetical protein
MILYKYVSQLGLKAIIDNLTIRFTVPSFFNDPFDCALSSGSTPETSNLENVLLSLHHRNRSGALCLTRNKFNLLMWAHYAENHKGAVIGFDTDIAELDCESKNIITAKAGSVIYTSIRPSSYGSELPFEFNSKSDRSVLEKIFLHKSIHWAYEEEVRIVRVLHPELDEMTVIHNGMAHRDFTIPKNAIREIYLGTRFCKSQENNALIHKICDEFTNIRFAKCYLDDREWKMKAIAISKSHIDHNLFF